MMPDGSCSMKTEAMTSWANEKIDPVKSCGDYHQRLPSQRPGSRWCMELFCVTYQ
jgi:hypothetical protein